MPIVAALHIYPVKSLRSQAVGSVAVEPWGLRGDRRFLVVDEHGRFLTQREVPRMAMATATVTKEALTLQADGTAPLRCAVGREASGVEVTVWRDRVAARLVDPAADSWLSSVLDRPCRLVHMDDPGRARPVDPAHARPGDHVSFADGFPVLLTSVASLADLNARLADPVGMDRFRPNLVVSGAPAWAEDGWRILRIGDTLLEVATPCTRCVVITTDQVTGARSADREPIRALQGFRRNGAGQVLFGQNLIARRCGTIAVGDAVEIES